MDPLILIAIVVGIGWWLYKSGKRTGSRKAYHVGLDRGRRQRRR